MKRCAIELQDMADRFAPAPSGHGSCTGHYNLLTFRMDVGNERARINLEYTIRSTCNVVNIHDRAKTNANSNGEISWIRSCVQQPGGSVPCKSRTGQLYDFYTRWSDGLPITTYKKRWSTDMEKWFCRFTCTTYRARWYMD